MDCGSESDLRLMASGLIQIGLTIGEMRSDLEPIDSRVADLVQDPVRNGDTDNAVS